MNRTLFIVTAIGTVLSGLVPLADQGDDNLFSAGATYVFWLLIPAVLLVIAAIGAESNSAIAGLGGGAALAVATSLGPMAIIFWKLFGSEFAGPGIYLMTVTGLVALVTAVATLGTESVGRAGGVFVLVLGATFLMSLGCTLIPSEYSSYGISWSEFNGFGEGGDAVVGLAGEIVVWAPVVAALIGLSKRGRFGALYALGGSFGVLWLVIVVQTKMLGDTQTYELFHPNVHSLAVVGAVLSGVVLLVAVATTASSAAIAVEVGHAGAENPARWAADPLGRHEVRYWDGRGWTEHVADAGVAGTDDGSSSPSPLAAPPTIAMPVAPLAATPAAAAMPAAAAPVLPVARPVVQGEAPGNTVPRRPAVAPPSVAELVFDSGRRVTVTTPLVIGRSPRQRDGLPAAALFPIEDHSMSVSATHLVVGPHASGVWAEDVGSTNGSVVAHESGETQPLTPMVRVTVPFGSEIRFGERSLRVVAAAGT